VMGMKERIFSPLPRDVSIEELVSEVNFYRRLEERLNLSVVKELVEDYANPSLLSLTRLPARKGAAAPYFLPEKWVFTPMAGAIHKDRLRCGVF
jgi:hypothetical protein